MRGRGVCEPNDGLETHRASLVGDVGLLGEVAHGVVVARVPVLHLAAVEHRGVLGHGLQLSKQGALPVLRVLQQRADAALDDEHGRLGVLLTLDEPPKVDDDALGARIFELLLDDVQLLHRHALGRSLADDLHARMVLGAVAKGRGERLQDCLRARSIGVSSSLGALTGHCRGCKHKHATCSCASPSSRTHARIVCECACQVCGVEAHLRSAGRLSRHIPAHACTHARCTCTSAIASSLVLVLVRAAAAGAR